MIHNWHEIRHTHIAIERPHAHRQLVAEVAHGRQPHPWDAQMFAQRGGRFHVIFVQCNNAVDFLRARQVRDRLHYVGECNFRRQIERLVETLARPIGVAQFVRRQQDYAAALALALAHELLPLFIRRDTQEGQRARLRHGVHSRQDWENTTTQGEARINYSNSSELSKGESPRLAKRKFRFANLLF